MRFKIAGLIDIKPKLPDGDNDSKGYGNKLLKHKQVAAARFNNAILFS